MNDARLTIILSQVEALALVKLAELEYRHPRSQAALIIRSELERRGFLHQENPQSALKMGESNERS